MSVCSACSRGLWFHERAGHPQAYCLRCASTRGIVRLCDSTFRANMNARTSRLELWWRWTVWLGHALLWDV